MTIKQQGGIFGRNPTFNEVDVQTNVSFSDNAKALFGNSSDLAVYHNGSNSIIEDTGSGNLFIQGTHVYIKDASGNNFARFFDNGTGGQIRLYHDASKVFETNSSGISITGNVAVTSGNGIDFSATSGTGTSELFDDYEEGTWTPVMADAASGGNTAAGGTFVGRYTKVGDLVYITFNGQDIDTTGMTSGNNLYVTGLPYTPATITATNYFTGALALHSVSTTGNNLALITDGTTYVRFSENVSGGANDWTTVGDLTSGSADIRFSLTYKAA